MKELILMIAQCIVARPESIVVTEVHGNQCTVFELKVDKSEVGKVIGKQGRTAQAIRTILNGVSAKEKKRTILEIVETYEKRGVASDPDATRLHHQTKDHVIDYPPHQKKRHRFDRKGPFA